MTWSLDVIIILIAAITIFFAAKNGFVKTLISALSFVIAIAITVTFAQPLSQTFKETAMAETIKEVTEEKITDYLLNSGEGSRNFGALLGGENQGFNEFIGVAGFDASALNEWFTENVFDLEAAYNEAIRAMAEKIAQPIIDTMALLLAIVVLFFGTRIVIMIVAKILDVIACLPVLKKCNKILGIILGIVLAFARICLFCFAISVVIENAEFLGSNIIESLKPDNTILYKFFSEIDIFSFFIK